MSAKWLKLNLKETDPFGEDTLFSNRLYPPPPKSHRGKKNTTTKESETKNFLMLYKEKKISRSIFMKHEGKS